MAGNSLVQEKRLHTYSIILCRIKDRHIEDAGAATVFGGLIILRTGRGRTKSFCLANGKGRLWNVIKEALEGRIFHMLNSPEGVKYLLWCFEGKELLVFIEIVKEVV